jgi:hypothetical protein
MGHGALSPAKTPRQWRCPRQVQKQNVWSSVSPNPGKPETTICKHQISKYNIKIFVWILVIAICLLIVF